MGDTGYPYIYIKVANRQEMVEVKETFPEAEVELLNF
jgi:hypothetical protein